MTTTDLLTRARSAVTVEEECAVIWDACAQFAKHGPRYGEGRPALQRIVAAVNNEDMPRAVLLGVVAALAHGLWTISSEDGDPHARFMSPKADGSFNGAEYREADAETPALALLIAILESDNVEA